MARVHADLDLLRSLLALQLDFLTIESLQAGLESPSGRAENDLIARLVDRGVLEPAQARLINAVADEHIRSHQGDLSLSLEAASLSRDRFSAVCELTDSFVRFVENQHVDEATLADDPHATIHDFPAAADSQSTQLDHSPPDPYSTLIAEPFTGDSTHKPSELSPGPTQRSAPHGFDDHPTVTDQPAPASIVPEAVADARQTVVGESPLETEATHRGGESDDPYATRHTDIAPPSGGSAARTGATNVMAESAAPSQGHGSPSIAPATGSRFRIIRRHARGGLGEVYLARDEELNRDVALKEIQAKHADQLSSRSRFLLEAEITGRLEHPGIVPVYGLGAYGDGRPYYAMRFISGESLRDAIERFHDPETAPKTQGERELELRNLLRRFVDTCNAVGYAHSRGVIHRDLKPANVMLGKFGETLVVDWGLAKALGRGDDPVSTMFDQSEAPLATRSGGGSQETQAGWAVGTPQFMSPEQAAGDLPKMGPACDIYSLGATLYVLLTGRVPFEGTDSHRVLAQVKEGTFVPPKTLDPKIPAPLNAICLKAMALEPSDRHASTRVLAEDLEHWLADEPVSCYAEPWHNRLARWMKRHRGATAAAALVALTLMSSLAVGNVLISRERDRTAKNFRIAHQAVDRMLTRLGQSELADIPQMEQVRKRLLDDAVKLYIELSRQRPGDDETKAESGIAYIRLGEIHGMLSELHAAERDHREGLSVLEPLAAAAPNDPTLARSLAQGYHGLGVVLRKLNKFREGEAVLLKALDIREGLVRNQLGNPEDRAALADTRYHLGALMARLGSRHNEALPTYEQSIRELRDLVEANRDRPEFKLDLARNLNNLGMLQSRKNPAVALKTFQESIALLSGLERESPGQSSTRWRLARAYGNVSALAISTGDEALATTSLTEAYDRFDRLVTEYPTVVDYRNELAGILTDRAAMRQDQGRLAEAKEDLSRALSMREALVKQSPEMVDYIRRLAYARYAIARIYQLEADEAKAIEYLTLALEDIRTLCRNFPDVIEYHSDQASVLSTIGEVRMKLGDDNVARRNLRRAIEERMYVRQAEPDNAEFENELLVDLAQFAMVSLNLGDHAEASRTARSIAELRPKDAEENRRAGRFMARCVTAARADLFLSPGDRRVLVDDYAARSIALLSKAISLGFREADEFKHPDYDSIRDRDDFRKLVGSIPIKAAFLESSPRDHQHSQR